MFNVYFVTDKSQFSLIEDFNCAVISTVKLKETPQNLKLFLDASKCFGVEGAKISKVESLIDIFRLLQRFYIENEILPQSVNLEDFQDGMSPLVSVYNVYFS